MSISGGVYSSGVCFGAIERQIVFDFFSRVGVSRY